MKRKTRVLSIFLFAFPILLIAIILFYRSQAIETNSDKEYSASDCFPNRSFHKEVDAATGSTMLWEEQMNFHNIKVTEEEKTAIIYPFMNSVFPADFSPASFVWKSAKQKEKKWQISFSVADFTYIKKVKETRFVPDIDL